MSKRFRENALRIMKSIYYMKDPKKITKEHKKNNVSGDEFVDVMLYLKRKGLVSYKKLEIPMEISLTDKGMEFVVNELSRERQEEYNKIIAITGSILAIIASYNLIKEFLVDKTALGIITLILLIMDFGAFFYLIKFLYLSLFDEK